MPAELVVQTFIVVGPRHRIDRVDVERLYHRRFADIAEQGDLALLVLRDRHRGAANQDIRLDPDTLQFLDRVLGGLGLQLTGRGDIGYQGDVDEDAAVTPQLVPELPDRLEEGQALDIADRATDLTDHEILVFEIAGDELLDRIGHVRDDLDRGAQIIATAFLRQHLGIDLAGGDIVAAARGDTGEAFVVAEVEVRFSPVIGHVDLAVLIWAHGPRIHVQIGVQLAQPHLESAPLEQRPEGCRGETFSK